jgi:transmembrane sensor
MEPQGQIDHKAIRDEASLWVARLDSGSADVEAFERWRDADPAHAAAFARMTGLWSRLGQAGVALDPPEVASPPAPSRRAFLRAAGVIGGACVIGGGAFATKTFAKSTASTRPGEQRRVTVDPGVTINLNTDSKVSWRLDKGAPHVWLDRGEAAVTVAPSAGGACVLKAGAVTVDLKAGEFNARLRGGSLDLLVLRGTGALQPSKTNPTQSTRFEQGQSVVATASDTLVQKASIESLDEASAWRRGEIVFQGAPLGAVVAEYNRYLTRKLVIADPELSKLRLGGRFTNSDPSDFLQTLRSSFSVRVIDAGDDTIVLTIAE